MTADFDWPLFLRRLDMREHAWNTRRISYPRADAVPFMPYPLQLFAALLMDAVAALPGWACYDQQGRAIPPAFLDVGCGPGTKLLLAEQLFGLEADGIDIVPEFIAEAQDEGVHATAADAFGFDGYDRYGIVLVNRPSGLQDDLEALVCERMRPGAILIAINWRNDPGKWGWQTVSQEVGEPVRGVWAKPTGAMHLIGRNVLGPTECCGVQTAALPPGDTITSDRPLVTCKGPVAGPDDGGFLPGGPVSP